MMSERLELYTPWRESTARLQERTVGRSDVLTGFKASTHELARGGRPLHRYIFGPRGVGKSHLLAVLRAEFESAGLATIWVSEDIPAISRPDDLLQRVAQQQTGKPGWSSWGMKVAATSTRMTRPTVLVVEGLDRRLSELGSGRRGMEQRQQLRGHWDHDPLLWVVGTGVELPSAFSDKDEAFFGWFHTEALLPLEEQDAALLLERVAELPPGHTWQARRDALVALAGGSPRVLVTLAETCARPETPQAASEALLTAVERFTPHFQMRFRDLGAQAQAVVDLLARAPREVSPGEMAERLGWEPATASKVASRLYEEGLLTRRAAGAHVWYRLAEPLLRFWIEYRTGPWAKTRVALAANLLEAMFSPHDIVTWWLEQDDAGQVVERAVMTGRSATLAASAIREKLVAAVDHKDVSALVKALKKRTAEAYPSQLLAALRCVEANWPDGLRQIASQTAAKLIEFTVIAAADLLERRGPPREVFRSWLQAMDGPPPRGDWKSVANLLLAALAATAGEGRPWRLEPQEREKLAGCPFLRAAFLQRGRLASHPPVLDPGDLATVALRESDPDLDALLGAAMMLGHAGLGERVLETVVRGGLTRGPGANPVPGRPAPRPELLCQWILMGRPLGSIRIEDLLTWSRSFADVTEPQFEEILSGVRGAAAGVEGGRIHWRAGEALVALGLASPDRLARVLDASPADVQRRFDTLLPFVHQLLEPSGGRLHPELARVKDQLGAGHRSG